jgi:hypothetical protein
VFISQWRFPFNAASHKQLRNVVLIFQKVLYSAGGVTAIQYQKHIRLGIFHQ